MPVHGLDRSTMLEGRSRIVNDPARQAEKGTFSFSAQQPSAPEGDILLSREAACGAPLGGGKQNVPAVNVPFSALPEGHQEVACFLSVPLKRGSTTVGMIGLANKPGGYAEADLEAVEALSLAFAEALAHKRAEQTIARLSREQSNRLVELAALNRELEAFSYSVSHDLRAPLRAMDGFSRLLLREYAPLLDAEGRHYIERVRAASQRMVCLIDDLLQLSRITRDPMQPEGLDLTRLAEEAVGALRAAEPGRAAEVTIAPGVTARGDGRLMRIALDNLLGNAWKFTGKRPTAHIEFGVTATGEGKVYFVRDDGAGFDMAYAGKLFTPFQRLHSMEEFPGTGLGLATVQRVIQRHGGRVWAEGNPGHGATFCFTLPDHE
ncbi:MAG: hypothetical protein FJ290_05735 [Planctomycetes bacterium]|nr:hypothetical protein [Planctomycetota bacterium]